MKKNNTSNLSLLYASLSMHLLCATCDPDTLSSGERRVIYLRVYKAFQHQIAVIKQLETLSSSLRRAKKFKRVRRKIVWQVLWKRRGSEESFSCKKDAKTEDEQVHACIRERWRTLSDPFVHELSGIARQFLQEKKGKESEVFFHLKEIYQEFLLPNGNVSKVIRLAKCVRSGACDLLFLRQHSSVECNAWRAVKNLVFVPTQSSPRDHTPDAPHNKTAIPSDNNFPYYIFGLSRNKDVATAFQTLHTYKERADPLY